MKLLTVIFLANALLVPNSAKALVSAQSDQHFSITIEVAIKAPVEKVYHQFLNIGDWWESSHTWFGDADKMYIEPKANGCFCEVNGDKEALHMTVSAVTPNKNVQMIGGLGPLQSMALNGHMSWIFDSPAEGITKLKLTYLVKGFAGEDVKAISRAVNGVLSKQISNLEAKFK